MPKKAIVLLLAAAMLLVPGCSGSAGRSGGLTAPSTVLDSEADYVTAKVRTGDVEKRIAAGGFAICLESEPLYFTCPGTIEKLSEAPYGSAFKKGEVIASLAEASDFALQISSLRREIELQERDVEELEASADGGWEVALAKYTWESAQDRYGRLESAGAAPEELTECGFEVRKAGLEYENAARKAKYDCRSAKTVLGQMRSELSRLESLYDGCFIRAPYDGFCCWRARIFAGEEIKAFTPVLAIEKKGDYSLLYIGYASDRSYISEDDLVKINLGGSSYDAKVVYAPRSLPHPSEYYRISNGRYRGRAAFLFILTLTDAEQQKAFNRYFETAPTVIEAVSIVVRSAHDALLVPTSTLQTDENGVSFVTVLLNGTPFRRDVVTGVAGSDNTQILDGLSEGETVVIPR